MVFPSDMTGLVDGRETERKKRGKREGGRGKKREEEGGVFSFVCRWGGQLLRSSFPQ